VGVSRQSAVAPPAPINTMWVTAMLEDAWAAAPESFRRSQYFEKGIALLQDMRPRVDALGVPVSWVHGDFKSDNIMMAGSRWVGLDMSANYENTTLLDISHFLNHLELSLLDPRAIRLLPRQQALIDRFKSGYGGFTENTEFCSS
jgi:Ser/Thr protein kinase RdoA (MazF antagonist)